MASRAQKERECQAERRGRARQAGMKGAAGSGASLKPGLGRGVQSLLGNLHKQAPAVSAPTAGHCIHPVLLVAPSLHRGTFQKESNCQEIINGNPISPSCLPAQWQWVGIQLTPRIPNTIVFCGVCIPLPKTSPAAPTKHPLSSRQVPLQPCPPPATQPQPPLGTCFAHPPASPRGANPKFSTWCCKTA